MLGGGIRIDSDSVSLDAKIGTGVYVARDVDIREKVTIGDYSYCSPGTIIFSGVEIGRYCSIGYNVQIGCPEHPTFFLSTSPNIYRYSLASKYIEWPKDDSIKPVLIGNDVWIGSNVIILQGVKICDGAIIAAGAVVNKDVPPFSIVGGVPAKVLKQRFSSIKLLEQIKESKWWTKSIPEIEEFAHLLYSKEAGYEDSSVNSD